MSLGTSRKVFSPWTIRSVMVTMPAANWINPFESSREGWGHPGIEAGLRCEAAIYMWNG